MRAGLVFPRSPVVYRLTPTGAGLQVESHFLHPRIQISVPTVGSLLSVSCSRCLKVFISFSISSILDGIISPTSPGSVVIEFTSAEAKRDRISACSSNILVSRSQALTLEVSQDGILQCVWVPYTSFGDSCKIRLLVFHRLRGSEMVCRCQDIRRVLCCLL